MLHVGSIRSGLFNWLWARHNGGAFLVRIEDTDQARKVDGAAEQIIESLTLLGLTPDEPATTQSARLNLYRGAADTLVASGSLYPCWCTAERLTELRQTAQKNGVAFKYDRHCLNPANQQSLQKPHVLRFRVPETPSEITWNDAVKGILTVSLKDVDDFVALKSDGFPTYHLANVIDDHDMRISHVLRADEWVASTPKHLLLFAAFGWEPPIYAHLPAVLGPDGKKKLSKRDGAQSVSDYLDAGYFPEVLINFMASLGWNDGSTQEIFTVPELISAFTLERIQKSPAAFDAERLIWMNGKYIRAMSGSDLLPKCTQFWPQAAATYPASYKLAVLELVHDRLKYLAELPELTDFFFTNPDFTKELIPKQLENDVAVELLQGIINAVKTSDFSLIDLETRLRQFVEKTSHKTGVVFGLVRTAVTGKTAAPGIFETLHVLGKEVALRRLEAARSTIAL